MKLLYLCVFVCVCLCVRVKEKYEYILWNLEKLRAY